VFDIKSIVPEGKSGDWKVEKFTVSEEEARFNNARAMFSFSSRGRFIEAGEYTRLMKENTVVMSDTPAELDDHRWFISHAHGNVLINGLGLGVVVQGLLVNNHKVERIVVNEISKDVIDLVAPNFQYERLTINHADAFTWKPSNGIRFNAVWHDIWNYICETNLKDMKRLHKRYGHWLQQPAFQGSWCREECER